MVGSTLYFLFEEVEEELTPTLPILTRREFELTCFWSGIRLTKGLASRLRSSGSRRCLIDVFCLTINRIELSQIVRSQQVPILQFPAANSHTVLNTDNLGVSLEHLSLPRSYLPFGKSCVLIPSNAHISTPFFQKTVFFTKICFGNPPSKFMEVCLSRNICDNEVQLRCRSYLHFAKLQHTEKFTNVNAFI